MIVGLIIGLIIGILIGMVITYMTYKRLINKAKIILSKKDRQMKKAITVSAEARRRSILIKLDDAMKRLYERGERINKHKVAKEAGVSYKTVLKYWPYLEDEYISLK